eukprot:sb/3474231/
MLSYLQLRERQETRQCSDHSSRAPTPRETRMGQANALTGILLNQKSEVSAETDRHRKNATVTVVLLCVVFLLTNVTGLVVCLILMEEGRGVFNTDGWFDAWLLLMVINATLNPVVILRRKLVDICCRVRISRISTIVTTQ